MVDRTPSLSLQCPTKSRNNSLDGLLAGILRYVSLRLIFETRPTVNMRRRILSANRYRWWVSELKEPVLETWERSERWGLFALCDHCEQCRAGKAWRY